MKIVLFLVGETEEEAKEGLFFDDYDSAKEYQGDFSWMNIYFVKAEIDWNTLELVQHGKNK